MAATIVSARSSRVFALSGWAVAACLAVSAAFLISQNQSYQAQLRKLDARDQISGKIAASNQRDDSESRQSVADSHQSAGSQAQSSTEASSGFLPLHPGSKFEAAETNIYRLEQDIDALQQRVSELRRVREERFQAVPGLSRLTVVEMRQRRPDEPQVQEDDAVESEDLDDSGTSESQLAEEADEPDPADPVIASTGWASLFLRALGYQPIDQFVEHSASPDADAPGGRLLSAGASNAQGSLAVVEVATIEGGYIQSGTFAAENPIQDVPQSDAVGVVNTDTDDRPGSTEPSQQDSPMSAYTIYDETTGHGSILVNNLPEPDGGQRYQLWMVDSMEEWPVNVGALPSLETGGGRVFFELGEAGYSPSEFFITQESEAGTDTPTGDPLLFGPDFSEQIDAEPAKIDRSQP